MARKILHHTAKEIDDAVTGMNAATERINRQNETLQQIADQSTGTVDEKMAAQVSINEENIDKLTQAQATLKEETESSIEKIEQKVQGQAVLVDVSDYRDTGAVLPLNGAYVFRGTPVHGISGHFEATGQDFIAFCVAHEGADETDHTVQVYLKSGNDFKYSGVFDTSDAETPLEQFIAQSLSANLASQSVAGLMSAKDKKNLDEMKEQVDTLGQKVGVFSTSIYDGGVNNLGEDTTQTNRVRTAFINASKAEVKIKITNANFIIRTANSYSSNDVSSHVAQVLPASTLSEYTLSQGFWYRVVLCKADTSANITHNEVESYIEMSSSDSIDGKIKGLETDITNVQGYFNSLIFNVNQYDNDFSIRYTLETAVAKVPTTLRKCGMMVTFRTNLSTGKFETYQYRLSSVSDGYFLDKANWINIGVYDKNIFNVNQYIGNYTNFLTIETATTNVPTEFRAAGMLILYRVSSSKWEIAQYSRPDTSDKYWTDLANWEIINKEDGSRNGYVQGSYDASNGTFYDNVKDAVSTKSIVINGGNVELITKTGFVMRGAFLTKQDGTYLQKLWSSENKTTYTFEYPDVALLYVIIKKEDGANVTPDECLGKLTVIGAVNDFDNSLERSLFGYKEKHSASTQWQQGAINTGTGEPVSMTTRISTGFLKGGVTVICKNELSIRSIVKYPSNTSYKGYEVVQNGVSLKDFVTPNDGFFYIFVIWDGNNGNLTVADAANIELFESDNLEGSVNRLSNNVETLLNGNVIKRAKWLALGDSITEGYYSKSDGSFVLDSQKGWAHHVSEINNYKLTNKGIGGSGFVRVATNDRPYNAVQLIDMLDLSDYNLVTIAWGVNDWKYNMALGTWEESTPKDGTIFGNMKYVVEKIISSNPLAKIVMITPINCKQGDESTNWGIGHAYPNNGTLEDIFNAIKRCCEYYCIELIDMTHTSIVNRKNIGSLLFDNVHPSELAHIMMARELSRKINCF